MSKFDDQEQLCKSVPVRSSVTTQNTSKPGPDDFVSWRGYQSNSPAPRGNKFLELLVEMAFPRVDDDMVLSSSSSNSDATMASPRKSEGLMQAPPKSPYPDFMNFSCGEQRFDQVIVFIWKKLDRKFWNKGGDSPSTLSLNSNEVGQVHSITKKVKQKVRKAIKPAIAPWDEVPVKQSSKRPRKSQLSDKEQAFDLLKKMAAFWEHWEEVFENMEEKKINGDTKPSYEDTKPSSDAISKAAQARRVKSSADSICFQDPKARVDWTPTEADAEEFLRFVDDKKPSAKENSPKRKKAKIPKKRNAMISTGLSFLMDDSEPYSPSSTGSYSVMSQTSSYSVMSQTSSVTTPTTDVLESRENSNSERFESRENSISERTLSSPPIPDSIKTTSSEEARTHIQSMEPEEDFLDGVVDVDDDVDFLISMFDDETGQDEANLTHTSQVQGNEEDAMWPISLPTRSLRVTPPEDMNAFGMEVAELSLESRR